MLHQDHWSRVLDSSLNKPRNTQADQDVKNITSNSIADRHISMAFLDNCNPWECIWNTDSCSYEGEAHDGVRNTKCEANDGDHPDHDVGVQADPEDTAEEGQDKHPAVLLLPAVWDSVHRKDGQRQTQIPGNKLFTNS